MADDARAISWEAPEHRHIEKTSDWFWVVGIIAISASVVSIILNNVLFSIVILLGATTMILFGHRKPKMVDFEISLRGIRINTSFYTYDSLQAFSIDEEAPEGPQLIVKSKHLFMPLIIIPLPDDYIDDIELMLKQKIEEIHMHEPLSHRLLEFFGF
jgi:hypothetical protein